jgi:hypothetical protein
LLGGTSALRHLAPLRAGEHSGETPRAADAANGLPITARLMCRQHCLINCAEFHRVAPRR